MSQTISNILFTSTLLLKLRYLRQTLCTNFSIDLSSHVMQFINFLPSERFVKQYIKITNLQSNNSFNYKIFVIVCLLCLHFGFVKDFEWESWNTVLKMHSNGSPWGILTQFSIKSFLPEMSHMKASLTGPYFYIQTRSPVFHIKMESQVMIKLLWFLFHSLSCSARH